MNSEFTVVSLGGSILFDDYGLRYHDFKYYADLFKEIKPVIIVVGGGKTARDYIHAARIYTNDEQMLDYIGIAATHLNAQLLQALLPEAIFYKSGRLPDIGGDEEIIILGGSVPNQTTDTVAASAAVQCQAKQLINMTSVDGVYDKDPKVYDDAKFIGKLTPDELLNICASDHKAGWHGVIDPKAVELIKKHKILTKIVNGYDINNVKQAILGEDFRGTLVCPQ